jgi:glycosyltransferase involved in cell wall biosynthesis
MSASRPSVSVVVPVFDAGERLLDAVESIERQGYEPLEIVVVDDGSTDDTSARIASLGARVRSLRQANAGPSAARNRGLAAARGELFAFLDADDLWPAGKLDRQVGALVGDPDLDVVLGRVRYLPEAGSVQPELRWEDPDERTVVNVQVGTGVYRRRAFERVGPFDETLRFNEDTDWFLRAREAGVRIRILEDVTLEYRLHDANMTRARTVQQMSLTRVLKMSLERRRAAGLGEGDLPAWRGFDDRVAGDAEGHRA